MPDSDFISDDTPIRVLIKLRKEKYSNTNSVYCPLLKEAVYFNNTGFFHATHDGRGKIREGPDARMRLNLLPYISDVIATSNRFGEPPRVRSKGHPENKTGKEIVEYELEHTFNKRKTVAVIVRRVGNGSSIITVLDITAQNQNRPVRVCCGVPAFPA